MRAVVRRVVAVLAPVAVATALLPSAPTAAAEERGGSSLHLVTLRAGATPEDGESALAAVEAPRPVYRWSRALRGYAVSLTRRQAEELQADPDVELVEPDRRLRLAGRPEAADPGASPYSRRQGGRGTVIGFVDTGLWPDSPLFADARGLGRPGGFAGRCQTGPGWPASACNGKVAGARWFLAGFGAENLRSSSAVSARDDSGHGTQMASLAAGNADVSVDLDGRDAGTYSGVAPRARVAVYKACWTAPDPADDGCSSADVVTAIDRAVADGVDVLNLSVAGSRSFDTVERALLGAAEADVVVVAAAGNTGRTELASHTSPWVTTVGGLVGVQRRGEVRLDDGSLRLEGAMLSSGGTATVPVVRAADAATAGARREDARLCRPGSLDAGAVAGALVVCDRGVVGRVDKSAAVARADGVGMILLNRDSGPDGVAADLHAVPTVTWRAGRLRSCGTGWPTARCARGWSPRPRPPLPRRCCPRPPRATRPLGCSSPTWSPPRPVCSARFRRRSRAAAGTS
ncbi:S8 family serine peptidase [Nocardioides rotundus]|uniref:S8 family serine peptidase n=1 Tax=Nocardioides rotundus TaxID=1774216 RepID=UPI001CBE0F6C|nr:S8 family serine peptidase [Nocardioides rotundus]UAL30876.1 S8 family serine peptidase [Nocardioides rotundus]